MRHVRPPHRPALLMRAAHHRERVVMTAAELEGLGSFPVLAGATFQERWGGRPVGELFGFVRENMPLGADGRTWSRRTVPSTVWTAARR